MARTAAEIFKMASALIYEKETEDADSQLFSIQFLNLYLQDCLDIENSIRRFNNEDELTEAPFIEALTEEIDYHDSITRVALPYALASHFYAEAMDPAKAREFENKYNLALTRAAKFTAEDITDAYAVEE